MVTNNSCNYSTGATNTVLTGNGVGVTPTFQAFPPSNITLNPDTGQGAPVSGDQINVQAGSDPNYPNNCGSSVFFIGDVATVPETIVLNVTDPNLNTIIGLGSGNNSIVGQENVSLGYQTLSALIGGDQNTQIGYQSGKLMQTASHNVGVGYLSLNESTGDQFNTAVGWGALTFCNGGSNNTAIGGQANNVGTPTNTVAVGANALLVNGGTGNVAVGVDALSQSTVDAYNVAIGYESLQQCDGGSQNTAIGGYSLWKIASGNNNVAVGCQSLEASGACFYNTAVGTLSLNQMAGSGNYNTAIGYIAGTNYTTTESYNLLLNSAGVLAESNILHIGDTTGTGYNALNAAYVCGITATSQDVDGATIGVVTVQNNVGASPNLLGVSLINGAFTWTVVSALTQALSNNHGYISNAGAPVAYTLPATATVGTVICITGLVAGSGWTVAQLASQSIQIASKTTTVGIGGGLASTDKTDSVYLVCAVANTTWIATFFTGNITVT
jgi:hypothetical protein